MTNYPKNKTIRAFSITLALIFSFFILVEAGEKERIYYDIVKRIEKAAGIAIRIKIIPSPIPDSYVYPDGAIVFTEGIIEFFHNDDEFAYILAHEVSHLKRKKVSCEIPLGFLLENTSYPDWFKIELEADILAVQLMAKAGYSPYAAVTFFSRFNTKNIPSYTARTNALSRYLSEEHTNMIPNVWGEKNPWEEKGWAFEED